MYQRQWFQNQWEVTVLNATVTYVWLTDFHYAIPYNSIQFHTMLPTPPRNTEQSYTCVIMAMFVQHLMRFFFFLSGTSINI